MDNNIFRNIIDRTQNLLQKIRNGESMTRRSKIALAAWLSLPSMLAQLSTIIMEYIDASMVGSLGAEASASIGLVSTTLWLFGGVISSVSTGFYVQVAHRIGAADDEGARDVLRQSLVAALMAGISIAAVGVLISGQLPHWLGGDELVCDDASAYFFIFCLSLPILQINSLCGGMLRSSGNMHVPSALNVIMCALDVLFNWLFIFPDREISLFGFGMTIPGFDMGVRGAALATLLATAVTASAMLCFLLFKSNTLRLKGHPGSFRPTRQIIAKALHIGLPMGIEHAVFCGAQIMSTIIVAPLGTAAIAANSFGIIVESLCYMPGYGIAESATTLVGQSLGARRSDLASSFARITVAMGIGVMTLMGIIMYIMAPFVMSFMTPDAHVAALSVSALRIEAFAEPMFAASIVAYGVFVGAGDTLIPCIMNLVSIWAVRISLAALLASSMGLNGVWLAMCIELCFRGIIFLIRLVWGKWQKMPVHNQ
ncbi:MAG: MATE family efflux transporter [Bacteroidales bacterium]|nr:MATE family efflux transporter [Bacteroidales bacterium]